MKSVGEVMAIGRTFKESLQKALRGLRNWRQWFRFFKFKQTRNSKHVVFTSQ